MVITFLIIYAAFLFWAHLMDSADKTFNEVMFQGRETRRFVEIHKAKLIVTFVALFITVVYAIWG